MDYLLDAFWLAALVLVVEKAALFHTKSSAVIALNAHREPRDPPLFRPPWRLAIYAAYLIGGLFALHAQIERPIGIALIVLPIFLLVTLDLIALRRGWGSHEDSSTEASD